MKVLFSKINLKAGAMRTYFSTLNFGQKENFSVVRLSIIFLFYKISSVFNSLLISSIFRFKNYYRSSPWDLVLRNTTKYLNKRILKVGVPESPFKNSFIVKYTSFADVNSFENINYFNEKIEYKFNMNVDLVTKDCFNFYHHININNITSITIKTVNILNLFDIHFFKNNRFNLFRNIFYKGHWLATSFVYENYLRTLLLDWVELRRNFVMRHKWQIILWQNLTDRRIRERYLEGQDRPANNYKHPPMYPKMTPFYNILYPQEFLSDRKKKRKKRINYLKRSEFNIISPLSKAEIVRKKRFNLSGFKFFDYEKAYKNVAWSLRTQRAITYLKYSDSVINFPIFYMQRGAPGVQMDGTYVYVEHYFKRERWRKINETIPFIPGDPIFSFMNKKLFLSLFRAVAKNHVKIDKEISNIHTWKREGVWAYLFYRRLGRPKWRFNKSLIRYLRREIYFVEKKFIPRYPSEWQIQFRPWKILDKNWYKEMWNKSLKNVVDSATDEKEKEIRKKNLIKLLNFWPNLKRAIRLRIFYVRRFLYYIWRFFWGRIIFRPLSLVYYITKYIRLRLRGNIVTILNKYLKWYLFRFMPYYLSHISFTFGLLYFKVSIFKYYIRYYFNVYFRKGWVLWRKTDITSLSHRQVRNFIGAWKVHKVIIKFFTSTFYHRYRKLWQYFREPLFYHKQKRVIPITSDLNMFTKIKVFYYERVLNFLLKMYYRRLFGKEKWNKVKESFTEKDIYWSNSYCLETISKKKKWELPELMKKIYYDKKKGVLLSWWKDEVAKKKKKK